MLDKLSFDPNQQPYQNTNNQTLQNASHIVINNITDKTEAGEKKKNITGVEDCQTCKNRRYQDVSNDPGVSFKSPTRMSPSMAATAVFSHEREHYARENAKAEQEGNEVISNEISIFTAVCPECGKTYISGGETRTTVRKNAGQDLASKGIDESVGAHMDIKV